MRTLAAITIVLLPSLALAQPKPVGPGGSCRYTSSDSFCARAPNGEGYDLNFESPIATLAKSSSDILGVG